jgi:hypothetical protein
MPETQRKNDLTDVFEMFGGPFDGLKVRTCDLPARYTPFMGNLQYFYPLDEAGNSIGSHQHAYQFRTCSEQPSDGQSLRVNKCAGWFYVGAEALQLGPNVVIMRFRPAE